jgi:Domain of unknown function (DUF1127)
MSRWVSASNWWIDSSGSGGAQLALPAGEGEQSEHGIATQPLPEAIDAKRQQIARELAAHNDRELFDLGVTRANIPQILDGTFSRG